MIPYIESEYPIEEIDDGDTDNAEAMEYDGWIN